MQNDEGHESINIEKLMDWCLDHGFEYVPIIRNKPVENWQSREKDGLPRLMEALQSHMWSTMIRKGSDLVILLIDEVPLGVIFENRLSWSNRKLQ